MCGRDGGDLPGPNTALVFLVLLDLDSCQSHSCGFGRNQILTEPFGLVQGEEWGRSPAPNGNGFAAGGWTSRDGFAVSRLDHRLAPFGGCLPPP